MKMTKTNFNVQVNVSSSWIVYITKTWEEAESLHKFALTQKEIMGGDWYYTVSTVDVKKDCRVPEFFHDHGSRVFRHRHRAQQRRLGQAPEIRALHRRVKQEPARPTATGRRWCKPSRQKGTQ